MRTVGDELGTGAASLYWHVRNKDELLQLMFERTGAEVTLPEPDPSRWQEQLGRSSRHARRDAAPPRRRPNLTRSHPVGPDHRADRRVDLRLLRPVGIPDRVIAYLATFFALYVGAIGFEEGLGLASPTGEDMAPEQIVGMLRDYVRSLPRTGTRTHEARSTCY